MFRKKQALENRNDLKMTQTYAFSLFLIFSLIAIVPMILMAYFFVEEVTETLIDTEKQQNQQIVIKTSEYMDQKIESSKKIIQDIYYSDIEIQKIINDILNETEETKSALARIQNRQKFDALFLSALYNDVDIVDIILVSGDGERSYVFSKQWSTVTVDEGAFDYPWVMKFIEDSETFTVMPSYAPSHFEDLPEYVYSMATTLIDSVNFESSMGVIIINYDASAIESAYESYEDFNLGDIVVVDLEGRTIFDSGDNYYGQTFPYMEALKIDEGVTLENDIYAIAGISENRDFIIASMIPEEALFTKVDQLRNNTVGVLSITILVLLAVYFTTSKVKGARINLIADGIKKVQDGDLTVRIPITNKKRDELQYIAETFNQMVIDLDTYIKRTYLTELRLKETELIALQSQINPHFIYNTLEIIRVKSLMHNNHDVANMIQLLSKLFRSSLKNDDMVISIKDELEYCQGYLELNQIRFMDRLNITYDIDQAIESYGTLKLILQPLIENTIVHGMSQSSDMVQVHISGYMSGDDILIAVEDTGVGIDHKTMLAIQQKLSMEDVTLAHQHIGLQNVNDRLKLFFGQDYGIWINSTENEKTVVTIKFPAMEIEEMKHCMVDEKINS